MPAGGPARLSQPAPVPDAVRVVPAPLDPVSFADMPGWDEDDHAAAFAAFLRSAQRLVSSLPKSRPQGGPVEALRGAAEAALGAPAVSRSAARSFFERCFRPMRVSAPGFVTGYFEPEAVASPTRAAGFEVPLYRRPPDLVEVRGTDRPPGWDPDIRFGSAGPHGVEPYFDRRAIEEGALAGRGLEIAWLSDPVEAYFIHVQGSARLRMTDGRTLRVAFDGKSGHPYTSIGRLAVERGILSAEEADKSGLEAWLTAHPAEGRALMHENRSFIFFRRTPGLDEADGPLGAAGLPLTAGRSLAVDRRLWTFHTPVWVEAEGLADPDRTARPFRRLMVAHDTGSAIVGPALGDLFLGSGDAAGRAAGQVRHPARMTALVPAGGEPRR